LLDKKRCAEKPWSFPGTVRVDYREGQNGKDGKLDENYRRYDFQKEDGDFRWFVENILSAVRPTKTRFNRDRGRKLLSQIFTCSDEAYALLMIVNELHVWEEKSLRVSTEDEELTGEGSTRKKRFVATKGRLFSNAKSGSKDGWDVEGILLYQTLVDQVKKRREEALSVDWEKRYLQEQQGVTSSDIAEGDFETTATEPDWDKLCSANLLGVFDPDVVEQSMGV
jgi:hypothetical protein